MLVGSKSWPTVLWRVAAIVRMCIPWKLCSYGQTSGSVHIGEEYVWQALCPRSSEGGGAKSGEVWRCVGAASTPMDSLPAWSRNFGKHIYLVQKFWLGSSLEEPATFSTNEKMPWIADVLGFRYPSQLPLPLALHGDGAPFLEHGSIQVLSMRCLLTKRIARHLLQSISQRLELKQKRCVHSKSLLTQAVRPKAPPSWVAEISKFTHTRMYVNFWI